jgi:hypothetical protein
MPLSNLADFSIVILQILKDWGMMSTIAVPTAFIALTTSLYQPLEVRVGERTNCEQNGSTWEENG